MELEVKPSFITALCDDPNLRTVYSSRGVADCGSERLGACSMHKVDRPFG